MNLSSLLKLLMLLPQLIGYAKDFIAWAEKEMGPNWDRSLLDAGKGFQALTAAQTEKERIDALKNIHSAFNPRR